MDDRLAVPKRRLPASFATGKRKAPISGNSSSSSGVFAAFAHRPEQRPSSSPTGSASAASASAAVASTSSCAASSAGTSAPASSSASSLVPPARRALPSSFRASQRPSEAAAPSRRTEEKDEAGQVTVTLALASCDHFLATLSRPHRGVQEMLDEASAASLAAAGSSPPPPPRAAAAAAAAAARYPLSEYEAVLGRLGGIPLHWGVRLVQIPRPVLAAATLRQPEAAAATPCSSPALRGVPPSLVSSMAPYQRAGVEFVLGRGGRALLADEMGLGKTLQAIGCLAAYRGEWPFLVLCPSSARYAAPRTCAVWLGEVDLGSARLT